MLRGARAALRGVGRDGRRRAARQDGLARHRPGGHLVRLLPLHVQRALRRLAGEAAARRRRQGGPHHLALRGPLAEPRRSRAARRACRAPHAQAPPLAPRHGPPPAPLRVADGGRAAHAAAAAGVAAVLLPKRAVRGPKGRGRQVVPPARHRVRLFRRVRAAAAAPAAAAAAAAGGGRLLRCRVEPRAAARAAAVAAAERRIQGRVQGRVQGRDPQPDTRAALGRGPRAAAGEWWFRRRRRLRPL
mmetsp:Transcript_9274/g.30750  ORF Transcript_9274/g.30750 Transcript_9274/m.30750 type:complete len:245 (+) Transcript_9274:828-1562(+)